MPLTPFHFGPALLVKGLVLRRFSWGAFVAATVAIDCETAYNIARRAYPLHAHLHTFIGATATGLAVGTALAACARARPGWTDKLGKIWPFLRTELTPTALLVGGLVGGASHPLLDGFMHDDIRPFLPFSDGNPLLGLVGLGTLHFACVIAGLIGAGLAFGRSGRHG